MLSKKEELLQVKSLKSILVKGLHGDRIAFESLAVYFEEGKGIKGGSSSAVD